MSQLELDDNAMYAVIALCTASIFIALIGAILYFNVQPVRVAICPLCKYQFGVPGVLDGVVEGYNHIQLESERNRRVQPK